MTQREKRLAAGLAVAVGLAVSFGVLWFFALEPYQQERGRAEAAEKMLTDKQNELSAEQSVKAGILKVDPRLTLWNDLSLPPRPATVKKGQPQTEEMKKRHVNLLQVDYEKYLHEMMYRNRFKGDSISITPAQVDKQSVAKGKQPTFERMAFRVGGRGDLTAVTGFMEEFHKAPLLHQIRNATVELSNEKKKGVAEGDLELKMTVEALLVTDAQQDEERKGQLVPTKLKGALRVLAEPSRNYTLLSKKNMFTGVKPEPVKKDDRPKPPKVDETPKQPKGEPREDVLRFVKLTMLCYNPDRDRWEATVYDQAKGGDETKLNTGVVNRELRVLDRFKQTSLDARVMYVDEQQLIFRDNKDKKFYRLRCGDFVYPAIREPLKASELKELGISAE